MSGKCIVHGCKNHRHEGRFVGDLCAPCHTMLAYGEINRSFAFFAVEITTLRAEVERLRTEVQTWQGHAKTAIWSDSEECKLLTADNERLRAALEWIVGTALTGPQAMVDKARAALGEENSND